MSDEAGTDPEQCAAEHTLDAFRDSMLRLEQLLRAMEIGLRAAREGDDSSLDLDVNPDTFCAWWGVTRLALEAADEVRRTGQWLGDEAKRLLKPANVA